VLIRSDSGGGTHDYLAWLIKPGRRLAYSVGFTITGEARRWEPKRLRLRIFTCAGRIVRGSRRLRLRLAASWPWTAEITTAITRLQALAPG
jgi:hypothetical protein